MKKIPRFKSEEEAARFWEAHNFAEYASDTKTAEIQFVKKAKKMVALRLDPADIAIVEAIAKKKGLSYTALLRMWIKEQLAKEARRAA